MPRGRHVANNGAHGFIAYRLETYARNPLFVRDIAERVANTNLDTLHLEDANVAYMAAADTLAAVVEALKEEARK